MRLYLHIGIHKTGSTAVQHFFAANRPRLKAQGLLYPRSGRPARKAISYGHHVLAREITHPGTTRTRAWDAVLAELRNAEEEASLISSENFDLLTERKQFAAIRSRLNKFDVKVIIYLRRQDEYLHSYYCTDVLFHNESREFHEYRKLSKIEPDYLRLLTRWENAFGRAALIVRAYEKSALVEGDIVADICAQVGVDLNATFVRPSNRRPLNASYSRNVINCIRWARGAGLAEDEIAAVRSLLFSVYRNRSSDADYLAPADRAGLLREFKESNTAVAMRYLDGSDGVLFQDLDTGDDAAWHDRYDGPYADLMISIADARQMFGARRRRPQRSGVGNADRRRQ